MNAKNKLITDLLNTMSREELSGTAKALGCSVGKSKGNTVTNIGKAIADKTARCTIQFTLRTNSDPTATTAPTVFSRKFRTHKDDKTVVTPIVASAPVPA